MTHLSPHLPRMRHLRGAPRARQLGLTLIEFMVSITIGMVIVAALATLIAEQSSARAEVDRSGRLIENGRYALTTLAGDVQLAGYWGEMSSPASTTTTLPDPCSTSAADIEAALGMHVQGVDGAGTTPSCLSDRMAGTDVLVIRRADPDSSDVETGGTVSWVKVAESARATQMYVQSGLAINGVDFTSKFSTGSAGSTTFNLTKKDKLTPAALRKVTVRLYYISTCSVCSGGDVDTKPTLKMKEITKAGTANAAITIAEGIEDMQIDYGVAASATGAAPEGADVSAGASALDSLDEWQNVMSVKIYLRSRSLETTPGYQDTKVYSMGTSGTVTYSGSADAYKRHVFVQTVRIVNPSARRSS